LAPRSSKRNIAPAVTSPDESDPAHPATAVFGESLTPGTMLGEYQIEGELGRGGMGTVYAARHPTIGKRVAIKVLELSFSCDPALLKRFTDEARAVNKIGHPYIIDVFSFGKLADGRQYFVMEFLEGETLATWLAKGRPDFAEARRLLLQVCEALEAAHREGVIHRDLKPENLWIARPKHGLAYIKVLDFGIAKLVETYDEKGATKTGMIMGTPQFMSPEQCMGRGVDHRTDIYALGAILFCVYCGRPPFDGESAAELLAAQLYSPPPKPSTLAPISPGLEALILSCLDKEPANRPSTAAELGLRLKDVASVGGAVTAVHAPLRRGGEAAAQTRDGYAPGGIEQAEVEELESEGPEPEQKSRWPLVLAVGALIAVAGLSLWLGTRRGRQPVVAPAPVAPAAASPALLPPAAQIAPSEAALPPPTVALPSSVTRSGTTRSKATAHAAVSPTAAAPAAETEPKHKPSRAAREGLIQENPF
jgi:serine/threonine-protein kinase